MKKKLLHIAGYTAVGLGFIGIFVPLLPTTPFLLLALFCFSKSSPAMNRRLLENKFFGKYLSDYKAGKGISPAVRITALTVMWSSMLFAAIVLSDGLWMRVLLIGIAFSVSVHILRIGTRKSNGSRRRPRILVLAPTAMEIEPFIPETPEGVRVEITGIGGYRTACNTLRHIREYRPSLVILAGIAGSYAPADAPLGECVLVEAETQADLGSFLPEGFDPKFRERFVCPHLDGKYGLRKVESNSVNAAAAPFIGHTNALIENMEGAAFFHTCLQEGIPFLELRAVSNTVGDAFALWNIDLATSNLARSLKQLIHETEA